MNIFSFESLLISISCLILAIIVFRYAQNDTHYIWGFFNIAVFSWATAIFFASTFKNPHHVILAWRWAYSLGMFTPCVFYHFVYSLCELKKPKVLKTIYAAGLLLLPLAVISRNCVDKNKMHYILDGIYYNKATPAFDILMVYLAISVILSFYELIKYLKIAEGNKRTQSLYILYGFGIGWGGGISTFLPAYGIPIYPWHITISVYTVVMTYAIFKHQMMDMRIIIRRSLIYSSLVTVITLIFLIFVFISEYLFHHFIHYQNIFISVVAASLIALIFTPLKNRIQDLVDKSFFKATPMEMANQNEKLKAVATLASSLAHEIKNPLTTLKTFTEFVPDKKDDPKFMEQYRRIVPQELDRINNLICELLAFAKPSQPQMQDTNPNAIIQNLLTMLEHKLKSSNIQLTTELSADTIIQADPNQLKQALLNLILNAIDAMPNGGNLIIRTETKQSQFTTSISDTGSGIEPKDLAHIFDPFFTKKEKGTGLGLSITQGIIEKHMGKISVQSKISEGTSFKISLPL